MDTNGGPSDGPGAVLSALADGTRRRTFELLAGRPMSVGELAAQLPVSRPAVSQHLKVLREAGLVEERRDGTRRVYSVNPRGAEPLREYLDRMWSVALERFSAAADEAGRRRQARQGDGHG